MLICCIAYRAHTRAVQAFTLLIERDAADLDIASDLSDDTYETFGVTLFHRGGKPTVKIARKLWEQRSHSNRLRITLAHEYGHVMLHAWLYDLSCSISN